MTSNTAPIKWAQRTDSLYITIALADVKDESIDLTDTELHFKGTSENKSYEVNIKFFQPIDSKNPDSTYKVLPRSVQMHVMKAAKNEDDSKDGDEEEFWPRLLQDKLLEKNQVKVDWDRYVDEDEEDEAGGFDTSGLEGGQGMGGTGGGMPGMGGGMEGMGGMPGMGGMGGMPGMGGMGGGMPGMEGMGGMDMEALMKQMGAMGGGGMPGMPGGDGGMPEEADSDDDDEEDLPDLE